VLEFAIALVLIALNGVFALSELAIVSARKPRLKTMADSGRVGAHAALALAEEPGRLLSTVQIGITLVGILAGAFSGAVLGQRLSDYFIAKNLPEWGADALGYGLVIGAITYLSVVIGELVPKHLALRNAEGFACAVAPVMSFLSRVAAPVVWLLDASTRLVFRVFGRSTDSASAVTEEEIKTIVAEAETAGIIEVDERRMIAGVLRLGDRAVRGVMTPRTDVDWIDLQDDETKVREALITTPHSRVPVAEGDPDNMIGVIQSRELLASLLAGEPLNLRAHVRVAPVVPDTLDALDALNVLREAEVPMALVHDEYGHFEGVVTPADILDAIAGAFRSDEETSEPEAVQREDGSWLLAGWMPADEMAEQLGMTLGWRFEVLDLDGRRIDKVLATRLSGEAAPQGARRDESVS
jgi:putative hemolysin